MIVRAKPSAYSPPMITAGQIRAARALIGWKQGDLAAASGVGEAAIKNLERGASDPRSSTLQAIQAAFENCWKCAFWVRFCISTL